MSLRHWQAKLISEKDKASEIPVSVLGLSNWRETSPSFFPTSTMAQWNKDAKTLITETSKGRQTNSRLSLCAVKEAQPLFLSLFLSLFMLSHQRSYPARNFVSRPWSIVNLYGNTGWIINHRLAFLRYLEGKLFHKEMVDNSENHFLIFIAMFSFILIVFILLLYVYL